MKRIYVVNDHAGNGKKIKTMKLIREACLSLNLDFEIISTKNKNDATLIAKNYDSFDNIIFSVGGDGTLNEIINGIEKSPFCVIPLGTGNDFYKSVDDNTINVDVGVVNDRYFINTASIGIDAEIAKQANKLKEKGLNNAYVLGIIKVLKDYEKILTDKGKITLLSICNGKYYGNGFEIAPFSKIDDGYLDLCQVGDINFLKTLSLLLKLIMKKHVNDSCFKHEKIKSFNIKSDDLLCCSLDGEIIYSKEFNFGIAKSKLHYYQEEYEEMKRIIHNIK